MSEKYIDLFNKIKQDWNKFTSDPKNNKVRIRDAANILFTNEASLLSTKINDNVMYLSIPDINVFLKELYVSEKLMFLVRNDSVVHENNVLSNELTFSTNVVFNKSEDNNRLIEFDANKIVYVFYEHKIHRGKLLDSFQFFDLYGESILKIYLKDENSKVFNHIAIKYKVEYNYELQKKHYIKRKTLQEKSINVNMPFDINKKDLKEYNIDKNIIHSLLDKISKNKIQVQIHINGNGIVQYYMGFISSIVRFGDWVNVLDKYFNLHAIEDDLSSNIVYRYKGLDEYDYSIEFFNKNNNHLMGITPLFRNNESFVKLINELGVVDE